MAASLEMHAFGVSVEMSGMSEGFRAIFAHVPLIALVAQAVVREQIGTREEH